MAFAPGEQQQTQSCKPWFSSAFETRCPVCVAYSLHSMTPKSQLLLPIPAASIRNINQTAQKAVTQSCLDGSLNRNRSSKKKNCKRKTSVMRIQGQMGLTGLYSILQFIPINKWRSCRYWHEHWVIPTQHRSVCGIGFTHSQHLLKIKRPLSTDI